MTAKEYKDLTMNEFTKAAEVYESDNAGVYNMAMNSAAVRWFCNTIEMPFAHLIGKGDVRIYGREDIRELSKNAGLHMEFFEKRGFCRLHCVVRKPE